MIAKLVPRTACCSPKGGYNFEQVFFRCNGSIVKTISFVPEYVLINIYEIADQECVEKILADYNLEKVVINVNNNSLFENFALFFSSEQVNQSTIRTDICNYISENRTLFESAILLEFHCLDCYVNCMKKDCSGDINAVFAFCMKFDKNVVLITSEGIISIHPEENRLKLALVVEKNGFSPTRTINAEHLHINYSEQT